MNNRYNNKLLLTIEIIDRYSAWSCLHVWPGGSLCVKVCGFVFVFRLCVCEQLCVPAWN